MTQTDTGRANQLPVVGTLSNSACRVDQTHPRVGAREGGVIGRQRVDGTQRSRGIARPVQRETDVARAVRAQRLQVVRVSCPSGAEHVQVRWRRRQSPRLEVQRRVVQEGELPGPIIGPAAEHPNRRKPPTVRRDVDIAGGHMDAGHLQRRHVLEGSAGEVEDDVISGACHGHRVPVGLDVVRGGDVDLDTVLSGCEAVFDHGGIAGLDGVNPADELQRGPAGAFRRRHRHRRDPAGHRCLVLVHPRVK